MNSVHIAFSICFAAAIGAGVYLATAGHPVFATGCFLIAAGLETKSCDKKQEDE